MNSLAFTATVLDNHRSIALEQELELLRRHGERVPVAAGRGILVRIAERVLRRSTARPALQAFVTSHAVTR